MFRKLKLLYLKLSGVEKFYTAPDGSVFYPRKKATPKEIEMCEGELGFELPKILKSALLNRGNGGYGPGYGLMCLEDIIGQYNFYREPDPQDSTAYPWPEGVLPILTTGCGLYYCVHCLEDKNPVYSTGDHCYDNKEAVGSIGSILAFEKPSLEGWMGLWK